MAFVPLPEALALAGVAALAGAINSIAGGGTLLSFPALIAFGVNPIIANATNSVALTPGSIASAFAYRRELEQDRRVVSLLLPPAVLGAMLGAFLLLNTPSRVFAVLVPVLVLFATLLLLFQNLRPAASREGQEWRLPPHNSLTIGLQFIVGVYGGYFGAGMGIMMLAILDRLGGANIHRLNGAKAVLGAGINGIASIAFVYAGKIDFGIAGIMSVGAVAGGAIGGVVARRIRPSIVRWVVVAIGLVLAAALARNTFSR